ncbi:MAG TPA: type II secretion system protein GspK [Ottowia sp.]|nr:type II secretion system protein GspK [Ottowia sp.]
MALIAVLWIVAALSLLVIGVSDTVRQQIRVVGTERDQVTGQALGEAAVALVLQQLQTLPERPRGIVTTAVPYAGVSIEVELAPLNGLISLNGAPPELLASLLQVAGGVPAGRAQALAAALVDWRDGRPELDPAADPAARQPRRFEAAEDVLLVPGVDYSLYARLAPLVSADLTGASRVNLEAAPPGVLAVLAQGNVGAVAQYLRQRASGRPGADASAFNTAHTGIGGTPLYRLTASVPLEAGKMLYLVQDVALVAGASRGAPWRVLRTHRPSVQRSG